ncbi:hypothetical protein ACTJIL_04825 [Luteimonas sp. 22616]
MANPIEWLRNSHWAVQLLVIYVACPVLVGALLGLLLRMLRWWLA